MNNVALLAVDDTLEFVVTSFDDYGILIVDVSGLSYSATITNADMIDYDIPCTIAYNYVSDEHDGNCVLPADTWGDFNLTVLDSAGRRVGAQTYNVPVSRPLLTAASGDCDDSAQVINSDVAVSINKADATSLRQLVYFSNTAGDNDIAWRYDLASNNGSEAIALSLTPASANLTTCDIDNITLALDFTNAQARPEPYLLTFMMTTLSYLEPSRAIPIELSATVSASASAELCTVELENAERLAVADTLEFSVTSIDGYGIRILDVAALVYSATIANEMLDNDIPCTVAYNADSDKHDGKCILPTDVWGVQGPWGPLFGKVRPRPKGDTAS